MPNHQHALVRYAALDRCLGRFRYTKAELIVRCSRAVAQVTGEERPLSEKTFYNDIRALREGLVLGRAADIRCVDGRYAYAEPGFSLFGAGMDVLRHTEALLAALELRAQRAMELLQEAQLHPGLLEQVRALLLAESAPNEMDRPFVQESRHRIQEQLVDDTDEASYGDFDGSPASNVANVDVFLTRLMHALGDMV